jgi:predicted transcriptional regulator
MVNIFNKSISDRILKLMELQDLTAYAVIKHCNIPKASFYKCIDNKSEWKVEHLLELSKYFEVTIDYLVSGIKYESVLKKENEKLKGENTKLSLEVTQLSKIVEAVEKYNKLKRR